MGKQREAMAGGKAEHRGIVNMEGGNGPRVGCKQDSGEDGTREGKSLRALLAILMI